MLSGPALLKRFGSTAAMFALLTGATSWLSTLQSPRPTAPASYGTQLLAN
jgi:hypothetical protein